MDNRILIMDDEEPIRRLYKAVIGREKKYEITEARNGKEGLDLFEQNLYPFVISDNVMPIMEGIESTLKMKEIAKEKGIKTKIMLISGTLKDKPEHIDYLLAKPINIADLRDIVNKEFKAQETKI